MKWGYKPYCCFFCPSSMASNENLILAFDWTEYFAVSIKVLDSRTWYHIRTFGGHNMWLPNLMCFLLGNFRQTLMVRGLMFTHSLQKLLSSSLFAMVGLKDVSDVLITSFCSYELEVLEHCSTWKNLWCSKNTQAYCLAWSNDHITYWLTTDNNPSMAIVPGFFQTQQGYPWVTLRW